MRRSRAGKHREAGFRRGFEVSAAFSRRFLVGAGIIIMWLLYIVV